MSNLLSKLSSTAKNQPIEPREIFMALPSKDKRYEYPRDVQADVWKKWFDKREQKNTIIKMNTGSGKTVVSLMILQSCLNEGKGPAVYVVPDNYLVTQVCEEAKKLGILAVTDEDDYDYAEKRAILVINVHKLVNGKSVFGISRTRTYPIGSVLLDDVHACLDTITTQFSLYIPTQHELYNKMVAIFTDAWKSYNERAYTDVVEMSDPRETEILPFWIWQDKQSEIYRLLHEYENDSTHFFFFNLPLIVDCLSSCNCVITSRGIEIMPKGIAIAIISSFENALRRIFMSATLADDGVFVSAIGLKKEEISDIITPEKANDIGDRLILFPTHLNKAVTDEDIKAKVITLSNEHNVVVIVPSRDRATFWDAECTMTITKENIDKAVNALKQNSKLGLVVLVNRYDGIDLPDDACRILVIDGLPPLRSDYDRYVQDIDPTSNILLREQVQKIEQGMGRGVRSNSDYCCVMLMGSQLADVLIRGNGVSFFSNATSEQYCLSKELWDLLKNEKPNPTVDEIFELADYSLNREIVWIEKSKERLSAITYRTTPNIDATTISLRGAFEQAVIGQWTRGIEILDDIINSETDSKSKGFLMQIKAEYTNFIDRSKAQQILKSVRGFNGGVLPPIDGIQYNKLINNREQAKALLESLSKISSDPNQCVVRINAVLDGLIFSPNASSFENSLCEIGELIGFESSRPEQEIGKGPDNLWAIGNGRYIVIECKSGTISDTIDKRDCNQLSGSNNWFLSEYSGSGYSCTPMMIHNSSEFDFACSPVANMRIMTPLLLDNMKSAIKGFIQALVQSGNWQSENKVNALLTTYKLKGQDIVREYTTKFSVKHR
ncbi:DEAD/DEAH box helicase [Clostridia bacterium]|nr:DEAD/DEAH box helicase [Clostridia bacterium]